MASLPGMEELGEGLDNVAYEVDGTVVRIRRADPGSVVREAALLRLVAGVSPLPVPVPADVDPVRGRLSYRKLPGGGNEYMQRQWTDRVETPLAHLLQLRGEIDKMGIGGLGD